MFVLPVSPCRKIGGFNSSSGIKAIHATGRKGFSGPKDDEFQSLKRDKGHSRFR